MVSCNNDNGENTFLNEAASFYTVIIFITEVPVMINVKWILYVLLREHIVTQPFIIHLYVSEQACALCMCVDWTSIKPSYMFVGSAFSEKKTHIKWCSKVAKVFYSICRLPSLEYI